MTRSHGRGDLAEDVGRHEPELGRPRGAGGADVQHALLESLRGGVRGHVLADDAVPLREQPTGGDLVVPTPSLGDLADESPERLGIPGVGTRPGPATFAQPLPASHRTGPPATDLFAVRTSPCACLLEGLPRDVITALWRVGRCYRIPPLIVGHLWTSLVEGAVSSSPSFWSSSITSS